MIGPPDYKAASAEIVMTVMAIVDSSGGGFDAILVMRNAGNAVRSEEPSQGRSDFTSTTERSSSASA